MPKYTCAGRGTCEPGCELYGRCHCGCGGQANRASRNDPRTGSIRGEYNRFINFHHPRKCWSRSHVSARIIGPDLAMLLRYRHARQIAWAVGRSEAWISMVRSGQIATIHIGVAQAIAELARGSRHMVEDTERKERGRTQQAERRARKKANTPVGRTWRESREGGEHVCSTCGSPRLTPHALYHHALRAHGDKSQGRTEWGKAVVV